MAMRVNGRVLHGEVMGRCALMVVVGWTNNRPVTYEQIQYVSSSSGVRSSGRQLLSCIVYRTAY